MDMNELIEPFARLVEDICTPAAVRRIEEGGETGAMWSAFVDSGFLDALVPEDAGGAGLSALEAAPLISLLGRHCVPLPVGDTMVARALLAKAGREIPAGPIAIATGTGVTPFARTAAFLVTGSPEAPTAVAAAATQTGVHHDLDGYADVADSEGLRPTSAVVRALLIAGAAGRVLEMTVAYANDRVQFGKPIGRQQAVQQQLAILAEQVIAARIAAAIGVRSGFPARLLDAAIAKHGTSIAAARSAAIAHAMHGAIGISEEYDLQLLTRRLHGWRLADGSESYWAAVLGGARLASTADTSVEFIRAA
ncbi:hypothetical protein BSL82_11690 [Tardibacter chloracetimidivorans]|uniref:Acyl-CoA dehydrogenase n=2 Tax=Tardibacter chloracetimidivorans TaxID=1921510 RepID=A0A1L3ZZP6_9SPHN|nr:hypothetical protein BSL82_11690 [Tardibacter chloracetimidivorans]